MKLATLRLDRTRRLGVVDPAGGTVTVLPPAAGTLDDIVRDPAGQDRVRENLDSGHVLDLASVELVAPLSRFNRDILCTGWNYFDHFTESLGKRDGQDPSTAPEHPTFFTKAPRTAIGPYAPIAYDPEISQKWDYEAEVALVIGRGGRSLVEDGALQHVFGYCVANDISQRDLQRAHGGQWLKGKSIDETMPLGPWITTADEIGDPYDLTIDCEVNGRLLQHASTRQVAFSFERIIAELSRGMTLQAGDLILTGTPAGIGNAREPQIFLRAGDTVVTRVSQLGELRNRVTNVDLSCPWPAPLPSSFDHG